MNLSEYSSFDATGLAELVRNKEVNAAELLKLAKQAADTVNPDLNAICDRFDEQVNLSIQSLTGNETFAGVPFLIKDLILQMRNASCRSGSSLVREPAASCDSELMSRFRDAGLITFGKTTSPAFGAHLSTESKLYGATHNPWNIEYTPGGSSGGSAAAVASGVVPMAHANDALGSIRIPASACHLFGLKPTKQRTPTGPHLGDLANGRGVEFVVSRTVRDAAGLLDVVSGSDLGAPYQVPPLAKSFTSSIGSNHKPLRIAFTKKCFSGSSVCTDSELAVDKIAKLCGDFGHSVVENAPIFEWDAYLSGLFVMVVGATHTAMHLAAERSGMQPSEDTLEPHLWAMYQRGSALSANDVFLAQNLLTVTQRNIGTFFADVDILLTPVLSEIPAKVGCLNRFENLDSFWQEFAGDAYSPFCGAFNVTGQPAASIPSIINGDGLPIGVQAVAPFGREDILFALAAQVEEAAPWADVRPPIYAGHS